MRADNLSIKSVPALKIVPDPQINQSAPYSTSCFALVNVIPPSIPYTKLRRDKLLEQYLGKRIVVPSSSLKVRGSNFDYQFRADSAFSWFTGIVAINFVPDSLFVMEPNKLGHEISNYSFTFYIGSYR